MEMWEKFKNHKIVTKTIEIFSKYTNTQPILDVLKSGKSIQKAISIILRIFAVIFWCGNIYCLDSGLAVHQPV